jgi:hypothetical protein
MAVVVLNLHPGSGFERSLLHPVQLWSKFQVRTPSSANPQSSQRQIGKFPRSPEVFSTMRSWGSAHLQQSSELRAPILRAKTQARRRSPCRSSARTDTGTRGSSVSSHVSAFFSPLPCGYTSPVLYCTVLTGMDARIRPSRSRTRLTCSAGWTWTRPPVGGSESATLQSIL